MDEDSLLDKALQAPGADCGRAAADCPERIDVGTWQTGEGVEFVHGDCEPPSVALRDAAEKLRSIVVRGTVNHDL